MNSFESLTRRERYAVKVRPLSKYEVEAIKEAYLKFRDAKIIAREWHLHRNRVYDIILDDPECRKVYYNGRHWLPSYPIQLQILVDHFVLHKPMSDIAREQGLQYRIVTRVIKSDTELVNIIKEVKQRALREVLGAVDYKLDEIRCSIEMCIDNWCCLNKHKEATLMQEVLFLKEAIKMFEDKEADTPAISEEELKAYEKFADCFRRDSVASDTND